MADLDALEAVLAKATQGEWQVWTDASHFDTASDIRANGRMIAQTVSHHPALQHDAAAIVALYNAAAGLIAEHRTLLARVAELEGERNSLRHVVSRAQIAFRHYAQSHRSKGTPEGDAKAETNQQLSDLMQAALEPKP